MLFPLFPDSGVIPTGQSRFFHLKHSITVPSFHFLSSVLYLSEKSHGVLLRRLVFYQVTRRGQIDLPNLLESLGYGKGKGRAFNILHL